MGNKVYFVNPNYSAKNPILIADTPEELTGTVNNGRKIIISSTVTDIKETNSVPTEFSLAQNYPNPFNPTTTISYQLPENGMVTLKVYNVIGREVAELVNEQKSAGMHEIKFDATGLASGTYIYKVSANGFVQTKKMILIK